MLCVLLDLVLSLFFLICAATSCHLFHFSHLISQLPTFLQSTEVQFSQYSEHMSAKVTGILFLKQTHTICTPLGHDFVCFYDLP